MSKTEDTLIQNRKEKHLKLNNGKYPIASKKAIDISTINTLMSRVPPPVSFDIDVLHQHSFQYNLHGRITNFRKSGGVCFINIQDHTGNVQIIATKATTATYENITLLDLGDIIEVSGYQTTTKAGEHSLLITEFILVTKAISPPPDKYFGVTDPEIKYRQRYVDLMSNEDTRNVFKIRSFIVSAIRKFLDERNFMEVETPMLTSIPSGANAKPFVTHHNALDQDMYLRIAPELYLKRLMGSFGRVYEIGKNGRNEGIDRTHNPEFTSVEFYSAWQKFPDLITYSEDILGYINDYIVNKAIGTPLDVFFKQCKDNADYLIYSDFVNVTMIEAVRNGLDKASMFCDDDYTNLIYVESDNASENDRQALIDHKSLDEEMANANTIGKRIAILFEYVAEPFLKSDYTIEVDGKVKSCPVTITEYPIEICPLARPMDNNPNFCDRGEMYINGKEVANFFQEINDPELQLQRFQEQINNNVKDHTPIDIDYISNLDAGICPTIGYGAGVDRLVMMFTNQASIRDVILFPTLKNKE